MRKEKQEKARLETQRLLEIQEEQVEKRRRDMEHRDHIREQKEAQKRKELAQINEEKRRRAEERRQKTLQQNEEKLRQRREEFRRKEMEAEERRRKLELEREKEEQLRREREEQRAEEQRRKFLQAKQIEQDRIHSILSKAEEKEEAIRRTREQMETELRRKKLEVRRRPLGLGLGLGLVALKDRHRRCRGGHRCDAANGHLVSCLGRVHRSTLSRASRMLCSKRCRSKGERVPDANSLRVTADNRGASGERMRVDVRADEAQAGTEAGDRDGARAQDGLGEGAHDAAHPGGDGEGVRDQGCKVEHPAAEAHGQSGGLHAAAPHPAEDGGNPDQGDRHREQERHLRHHTGGLPRHVTRRLRPICPFPFWSGNASYMLLCSSSSW